MTEPTHESSEPDRTTFTNPRESADDVAILAALDFPTPSTGRCPPSARARTKRAAAATVGVVVLSLVMLALIIAHPFLAPLTSALLVALWIVALGATIGGLISIGRMADNE